MKSLTLNWGLWVSCQPTVLSQGLIFHQCAIHINLAENVLHLKGYEMRGKNFLFLPRETPSPPSLSVSLLHPPTSLLPLIFLLRLPCQTLLHSSCNLPFGFNANMPRFIWCWSSLTVFYVAATELLTVKWSDDRETYQHLTMLHYKSLLTCRYTRQQVYTIPKISWWTGIKKHWNVKQIFKWIMNLFRLDTILSNSLFLLFPHSPRSCAYIFSLKCSYFPSHLATALSCAWIICFAADHVLLLPFVQVCNCNILCCCCCCIKQSCIHQSLWCNHNETHTMQNREPFLLLPCIILLTCIQESRNFFQGSRISAKQRQHWGAPDGIYVKLSSTNPTLALRPERTPKTSFSQELNSC